MSIQQKLRAGNVSDQTAEEAAVYIDALQALVKRQEETIKEYENGYRTCVARTAPAPKYDEENYREQMKDAGRGHLLR